MDIEKLKRKRAAVKGTLTRIENFVIDNSDTDVDININEFVTRETLLIQAYEKYSSIQEDIEELDSEDKDRVGVEDKYVSLLAQIKTLIDQLKKRESTPPQNVLKSSIPESSSSKVTLPNITIPSFTGKHSEWSSFKNLFDAIVHDNDNLSDVQKFTYLKSSLKNEPLSLIQDLLLTNENYEVALDILSKRYDDQLIAINMHLSGLLEINSITRGDSKNLRQFIIRVRQNFNSLQALKLPVDSWDIILVFLLTKKLDFQTQRAYELEGKGSKLPTFQGFMEFIEKRCRALENLSALDTRVSSKVVNFSSKVQTQTSRKISRDGGRENCLFCKLGGHSIYTCDKFKNTPLEKKREFVQLNRMCYNCLGSKHTVTNCMSSGCRKCNRRHNTLLCPSSNPSQKWISNDNDYVNVVNDNNPSTSKTNAQTSQLNFSANSAIVRSNHAGKSKTDSQSVILATARVNILDTDGRKIGARALLDCGSQMSFISSRLAQKLGQKGFYKVHNISGISGTVTRAHRMLKICLESIHYSKKFELACTILDNITTILPQSPIDRNNFIIPQHINLADVEFHEPDYIDLLIGADLYFDLIIPEIIKLGVGQPVLQNSYLGWLVAGQTSVSNLNYSCHLAVSDISHMSSHSEAINLDEFIPKFWQLEELSNTRLLSTEDKICETRFLNSITRLEHGSYQVDIPFSAPEDINKLGDSFQSAKRRFLSLERKFQQNSTYRKNYIDFIREYVNLGHAKYVEFDSNKPETYHDKNFLPHHGIIKESSASTPLRVVFDASMKTSSGLSLNDIMLKGFPTQPDLSDILIRFRLFKYVLTTDIQRMFRMIWIAPDHRKLQNILWRENPEDPLQCIELQTVTYGTRSAPFLATRCLRKLAMDEKTNYPLASDSLLKQCYMDDILSGSESLSELRNLKSQLIELLDSYGFKLHKWHSNYPEFNENTKEAVVSISDDNFANKVLGISWNTHLDNFQITTPLIHHSESKTKRQVLSTIAQIYDPLGLVGPCVVIAKMIMQEIWLEKLNWDSELNPQLLQKWQKFENKLTYLSKLPISRCVFKNKKITSVQLHGFSDASTKAYGACVYIRALYEDMDVSCNLLCSKSRIAPLKTISLPRLELCGAALLAKLIHKLKSVIQYPVENTFLWCDSKIVLCWLQSPPTRWQTFVANRVAEVQELTGNCIWLHINSADNPADHLSRGIFPQDLNKYSNWWTGPDLLKGNFSVDEYCNANSNTDPVENIPELKRVSFTTIVSAETVRIERFPYEKFSKYFILIRCMSYCLRFIKNCRDRNNRQLGPLTVSELIHAEIEIIKIIQKEYFKNEIINIENNRELRGSSLSNLNLFIDGNGLVRLNTRLANAPLSFDRKFPILLPSKNHVVRLLIISEHLKLLHAGPQTVLANLRLKYWIVHGIREIKSALKGCVTCFRFKAQTREQIMGYLPADRVTIAKPFQKVGIDYAGPILVKESRLRRSIESKCYIALFICMVTKAVHIELVSDLSTPAFMHTLKRFVARRGHPEIIWSDNGSNFRGAANELKEVYNFLKQKKFSEVFDFLSVRKITWKFIPPNSPHWGGLWEANIKSMKNHLKKVFGGSVLSFEAQLTCLAQIEAVLNSRPLCAISSNSNDLDCLTPGHFLIGQPLMALPEKNFTEIPDNRLKYWELCQKRTQQFWKRWSVEYLHQLQTRAKWHNPVVDVKENTMVLIKEDNLPPLKWPLARVIKALPGSDGRVRVVELKTQTGNFIRPITKLCPLPVN